MNRRRFNRAFITASAAAALAPFNIARAQTAKFKLGVPVAEVGLAGANRRVAPKVADDRATSRPLRGVIDEPVKLHRVIILRQ